MNDKQIQTIEQAIKSLTESKELFDDKFKFLAKRKITDVCESLQKMLDDQNNFEMDMFGAADADDYDDIFDENPGIDTEDMY